MVVDAGPEAGLLDEVALARGADAGSADVSMVGGDVDPIVPVKETGDESPESSGFHPAPDAVVHLGHAHRGIMDKVVDGVDDETGNRRGGVVDEFIHFCKRRESVATRIADGPLRSLLVVPERAPENFLTPEVPVHP